MNWRFWSRSNEQELERELRAHLDLEAEEQGDLDAARRQRHIARLIANDSQGATPLRPEMFPRQAFEIAAVEPAR